MNRTNPLGRLGVVVASLLVALTTPGRCQSLPPEVHAALAHRVGRWEGRNEVLGADGATVRVTQEAHDAQFVINGAIVEIRGHVDGREDFRAFLLYNPSIRKYVYTTIDRSNNHVVMTAEASAPYRFTSQPFVVPDGRSLTFRLVYETVERDRIEGYGEASWDGGATWRRVYNQVLRRVETRH
jgi:hypothetical protein